MKIAQQAAGVAKLPVWRVLPGGMWVLIALLLLLQGPPGALEALKGFAVEQLGGQEVVRGVLWQTAPLAIAAALISYGVAAGWVSFENYWSVLAACALLVASGPIGIELRKQTVAAEPIQATLPWNGLGPLETGRLEAEREVSAVAALAQLTSWETLTAPPTDQAWDEQAKQVRLFPKSRRPSGVAAFWVGAVEQLLGYLLAYRPRLFLAGLLAGGYVGWSWHRRVERFRRWVAPSDMAAEDESKAAEPRLAA